MRILISGAGGTVGRGLAPALAAEGHTVLRLVRARPRGRGEFRWDPAAGIIDPAAIPSCEAVVHLAGASIAAGRWNAARKAEIMESRRAGTRLIAGAIAAATSPPRVFVCASAVGYYGDRGDEVLTEASPPGRGFLAAVARAWEAEAARAPGTRVVRLRLGMVLTRSGGALPRLMLPFRLGLGGPVGGGRQWMSWIALEDLIRIVRHVLARDDLDGPVNAVSPHPVTQGGFARALGAAMGRPSLLPTPGWLIGLALGEMGRELILDGQRVVPARLLAAGFAFERPEIGPCLLHLLRSREVRD